MLKASTLTCGPGEAMGCLQPGATEQQQGMGVGSSRPYTPCCSHHPQLPAEAAALLADAPHSSKHSFLSWDTPSCLLCRAAGTSTPGNHLPFPKSLLSTPALAPHPSGKLDILPNTAASMVTSPFSSSALQPCSPPASPHCPQVPIDSLSCSPGPVFCCPGTEAPGPCPCWHGGLKKCLLVAPGPPHP